ncbi:hypothetical protein PCASD_07807 [Puccinia coronata f. sp. avenae]|uniref:Uncharacterized protein n=1 Tax=Puccinia coronata f. sp. avenae TaxID=200324 RepID=A0A2N5US37_9BASI|nr:hypothetical protein PCASD_07807 [Puccinia coronata f. sp. avenae]
MTKPRRCGFKDPIAAVARLTPIAQAKWARIEAARSASGNNPFGISIGRTAINAKMKPRTGPSIPMITGRSATIEPLPKDAPQETTFRARITGANIGLSFTNWQRTVHKDPPPPPYPPHASPSINMSNMALLIAELKAQCEDDRTRRAHEEARYRRKQV